MSHSTALTEKSSHPKWKMGSLSNYLLNNVGRYIDISITYTFVYINWYTYEGRQIKLVFYCCWETLPQDSG